MANKMLIDAAHPEETRVVVIRGNQVEEFDYESTFRKQLRGNIYLAKVTRVEPSLQAAFVDYGGNRHGFLAFNEIHPDYYQIPESDKKAMLKAEAEAEARWEKKIAAERKKKEFSAKPVLNAIEADDPAFDLVQIYFTDPDRDEGGAYFGEDGLDVVEVITDEEDAYSLVAPRPKIKHKHYRIQEVIKRNQIIVIQVSKEERGNKGAALTTYLSLAGRFTVLMPNTERGGGISRKIENASDRKRLREVMDTLKIPEGMGLIVRTAGANKTKIEVKRDYDYLLRLWESIRTLTLKSTAPALTYEEGNLIKRSVRDLYDKDISEILVSGEKPYREAKAFMRTLMPSHAKNVKPYKDHEPIFMRHQVERQLNAMFSPFVTLKSGGYIVINQTEALVAIDVNSGKSTKEKSIEETALSTNLEAAEEIARQLRLRDMAGLIVIDYIDMNERRNNKQVEKKTKDCLRTDRARIQVGRISSFGLMEMSRQRMRTGVLEGSTTTCEHCQGTGMIRSTESVALYVLRSLEDVLMNGNSKNLNAVTSVDVALYILNKKRDYLQKLEEKYDCIVLITANAQLLGANFSIEKIGEETGNNKSNVVVQVDWAQTAPSQRTARDNNKRSNTRNTRKNTGKQRPDRQKQSRSRNDNMKGNKDNRQSPPVKEALTQQQDVENKDQQKSSPAVKDENGKPRRRRRSNTRTNKNNAPTAKTETTENQDVQLAETSEAKTPAPATKETPKTETAKTQDSQEKKKTRKPRTPRRAPRKKETSETAAKAAASEHKDTDVSKEVKKPQATKTEAQKEPAQKPDTAKAEKPKEKVKAEATSSAELPEATPKSKRRGWWSRPS